MRGATTPAPPPTEYLSLVREMVGRGKVLLDAGIVRIPDGINSRLRRVFPISDRMIPRRHGTFPQRRGTILFRNEMTLRRRGTILFLDRMILRWRRTNPRPDRTFQFRSEMIPIECKTIPQCPKPGEIDLRGAESSVFRRAGRKGNKLRA